MVYVSGGGGGGGGGRMIPGNYNLFLSKFIGV